MITLAVGRNHPAERTSGFHINPPPLTPPGDLGYSLPLVFLVSRYSLASSSCIAFPSQDCMSRLTLQRPWIQFISLPHIHPMACSKGSISPLGLPIIPLGT